ncbi:hypothetical protein HAX54_033420 [Datura stramonium]|uniref:Pentatricopeptide repeat-containing protein n=1 Tax=Datura stramonium TaxID=4076 RepID=A0ABS8VEW9_DATST|nr:hypothetical protein [Datura stramonium]
MQEARLVDDCIPYCAVISSFVKVGQLEMAEAILNARKMRELGLLTPDLLSYNNVLGLYTDGRFKEALATYKEMLSSSIQPDDSTFKSLGIVLLKSVFQRGCCSSPTDVPEIKYGSWWEVICRGLMEFG